MLPYDEVWLETRADCVAIVSFQLLELPGSLIYWFPRSCFVSNRFLRHIFFTPSFIFGRIHIP